VLLQLFRGAGVAGLAAMPASRDVRAGCHRASAAEVTRAELALYAHTRLAVGRGSAATRDRVLAQFPQASRNAADSRSIGRAWTRAGAHGARTWPKPRGLLTSRAARPGSVGRWRGLIVAALRGCHWRASQALRAFIAARLRNASSVS
jgi:hypothetical protein